MKRYHALIKGRIQLGLVYSFRGLVYSHHSRENGNVKAGIVMKKLLSHMEQEEKDTGPGLDF